MLPVKKDLTQNAKNNLPNQFYNKPNLNALLQSYVQYLKDGGDQIFDIAEAMSINSATGYLLDCVGSYVAVLRNGDTDNVFRERIRRQILIASSEGTPNDLLENLAVISSGVTNIWEHFPFGSHLSTQGFIIPISLTQRLREAAPATSGDIVVYINFERDNLVPAEISFSTLRLADHNLSIFSNENGDEFTVNNANLGAQEGEYAELSEYTYGQGSGTQKDTPNNRGYCCEIASNSGGVVTYRGDYDAMLSIISQWRSNTQVLRKPTIIAAEFRPLLAPTNISAEVI